MTSKKEIVNNKEVIQGVLIVDNFTDNFAPFTDDTPFGLLPLVNIPILEWNLEYLSLGGIEELFIFTCSHVEQIKRYIKERLNQKALWSVTMKVHILVSESCRSLGDCLRDLDAKGLLRGTFVLAEAGAVGHINFLPIIEKHNEFTKKDKGNAMTMINIECGGKRDDECPFERQIVGVTSSNRIVYHKRRSNRIEKKHKFELSLFLEHSPIQIRNDLLDTRVAICSSVVLPLFSDNFDFQTKDDFVRGLLMNEEIMGSTIYTHIIKVGYGSAVTSWRRYQKISQELMQRWAYPIVPVIKKTHFGEGVLLGDRTKIDESSKLNQTIIGNDVKIGKNVTVTDSFIFANCTIGDNCTISHSIIGNSATLKKNCKLSSACILGPNVILNEKTSLQNVTVKSTKPDFSEPEDKISNNAYKLTLEDENEMEEDDVRNYITYSKMFCENDRLPETNWESDLSDTDDEELSHTRSPPPDDTNLFFTEVIDSLARGFEDKLLCDNLILEINSSRYAYNVTLKEVNYNVVKAILSLPFQLQAGQQYWSFLRSSLEYFTPILKNYIRNEEAMGDCLAAMEDVVTSNTELHKCIANLLNWFYEKDHVSEEAFIKWYGNLDRSSRLQDRVQPFIKWLQEAEEATSSDED